MKVLIIRFSSLGDIVLTSPIVRCLHLQLEATIHFVTKKVFADCVRFNPHIAQLFFLEDSINLLIEELKKQRYDLVIDLHKNIRSKKITKALGVKYYAYNKQSIERWMLVNLKRDFIKGTHVVDRYFSAVSALEVSNDKLGLDFYIDPHAENIVDKISKKDHRIHPASYIVIVAGTAHFTKTIPQEKILDIISKVNYPVILLGGPGELKVWKNINCAGTKNFVNLVGITSISESAALIKNALAVITPDTGMMHIAAALEKKILVVLGSTTEELGFMPYMPQKPGRYTIIQDLVLKCRPCTKMGRSSCPKRHFKCMKNLKTESIIEKIEYLIDI